MLMNQQHPDSWVKLSKKNINYYFGMKAHNYEN